MNRQAEGGCCGAVSSELHAVKLVRSSTSAFAALRMDGSVATWGYHGAGGDSRAFQEELLGGSHGTYYPTITGLTTHL